MEAGSKWSVLYKFNAAIFLLEGFNAGGMILGIYWVWARVISAICGSVLGIINFTGLITTLVLRFRPIGRLCAMSIQAVKVEGGDTLTTSRTYHSDSNAISIVFTF
mmetsp:Transcript_17400/g.21977  ORF Transcript_17400/g.21977 Transcript_17400/m.21977 type:complete len:106 (+) Transcript_17400:342-659(+)